MLDIAKKLVEKLEKEQRSKVWFVRNYCEGMQYNTVNKQISGYTVVISDKVKNAIEKYLKEK